MSISTVGDVRFPSELDQVTLKELRALYAALDSIIDEIDTAVSVPETRSIAFVVDGGGAAIAAGVEADVYVPFSGTITRVTMLADQSGSVVVDIWGDAYSAYAPTAADSIVASAKPTISSAIKSQDSTLLSWNKAVTAGQTLRFHVDSCTSIERLHLSLSVVES